MFTVRLGLDASSAAARLEAEHVAGRLCAAEALRQLDPALATVAVGRAASGAPLWPDGVTGSITHAGGVASAAVGWTRDARSIGLDSQPVVSAEQAGVILPVVAWPCEVAEARAAGLDRRQALTLVFSAKETVFKCLFPLVGIMFDFHDVRVIAVDARTRRFQARLVKTLSSGFAAGTLLEGQFAIEDRFTHTGMLLAPASSLVS